MFVKALSASDWYLAHISLNSIRPSIGQSGSGFESGSASLEAWLDGNFKSTNSDELHIVNKLAASEWSLFITLENQKQYKVDEYIYIY